MQWCRLLICLGLTQQGPFCLVPHWKWETYHTALRVIAKPFQSVLQRIFDRGCCRTELPLATWAHSRSSTSEHGDEDHDNMMMMVIWWWHDDDMMILWWWMIQSDWWYRTNARSNDDNLRAAAKPSQSRWNSQSRFGCPDWSPEIGGQPMAEYL